MIVYKYGALSPVGENANGLRNQMRLGHDYYQSLVEAHNERMLAIRGEINAPDEKEAKDAYFRALRQKVKEAGFMDIKPIRAAATARGLYWGTYLRIEEAFQRAQKSTDIIEPLRFRSFRSTQVAAVQIQKPDRLEKLVRWERVPDPVTFSPNSRRAGKRHLLHIRIGSHNREPIWATVPLIMHREPLGRIRWVAVHREIDCGKERWWVTFTCSDEPKRTRGTGVVAVDVGWRLLDDKSLRVAYASDGNELRLSPRWLGRIDKARDLRSIRDKNLNVLKGEYPEMLARVRSWGGVAKVHQRLGDDSPFAEALKRDQHLWEYQRGNERRIEAHRRNEMRCWIRNLRRQYGTVIVKKEAIKRMKEEKKLYGAAKRNGQYAAPGEMYGLLKQVFGEDVVEVKGAWSSCTCTECGAVNEPSPALMFQCASCGYKQDRDVVSTSNLMAAYQRGEGQSLTAAQRPARFAKRHIPAQ